MSNFNVHILILRKLFNMVRYVCSYENCQKSFPRPSKLQNHYNLHTGIRPFKCAEPDCGKAYSSSSHLQRHMKCHLKIQPTEKNIYTCVYKSCNATFETLWGLQRHEDNHLSPFYCEKCNKYFRSLCRLNNHRKRHEIVSQRRCQYCGEDFGGKLKRELLRHEKKHSYMKCEFCDKFFQSLPLLQRHLVKHESIFECAHCGKILRRKNSLRDHIKMLHTGFVSPYVCEAENCSKIFLYKRNYINHKIFHDKEAQFKCPIANCHQHLLYRRTYNHHLKLHQKNRIKIKKKEKVDVAKKLTEIICD